MLGARRFRSEGRRGEEGCPEKGKAEMLCLVWRREEKKSLFFYKAFLPCSLGIVFLLWVISPASLAGTAGAVSIGGVGRSREKVVAKGSCRGVWWAGSWLLPIPRGCRSGEGCQEQEFCGCVQSLTPGRALAVWAQALGGWVLCVTLALGGRNKWELLRQWVLVVAQVCWGRSRKRGTQRAEKSCDF